MQKFFSNKKLIILMITLIITMSLIAVSIGVRNNKNTPPIVQQFGNDVVGLAGRAVSWPANKLHDSMTAFADLTNTYQENQKLKKKVDQLAQTQATNQTLAKENKELKQQLKLDGTLSDYEKINASVMSRNPDNWQNIILINKGSLNGIKKNMPVMSGSGVIGRVIETNKTDSKVELISTENKNANRFAATLTTSSGKQINGLITGYDKSTRQLIFGQLNNTVRGIKKGDKVITSGLGGLTPEGLLIGTVQSVKKDDYGLAQSIYLKPSTNMDDFTVTTVISRKIEGE